MQVDSLLVPTLRHSVPATGKHYWLNANIFEEIKGDKKVAATFAVLHQNRGESRGQFPMGQVLPHVGPD